MIKIAKTMIVNKNEEKRLITLPLLIPDYDDCDAPIGEKQLSVEEIADFSYKYMEKYRKSDGGHTYLETKKEVAVPVESWQLREDTVMKTIDDEEVTYPTGTWMATLKVFDDNAWDKVIKGEYTGGSVTVLEEAVADEIVLKEAAEKGRVLIKDIPDPVVATIALVDKPCVFGAKFCSVKAATKSNNKEESFEGKRDKIRQALRKTIGEETYIELTFDDKVIVRNWEEDAYYEIPYSINVNGEVEFGTPVEVEQEFVAKKMLEIAKKAGRTISESTFKKIKNAWESLGKLMDKANNEREENPVIKSDKMVEETKTDNVVTKEELNTALKENNDKLKTELVEAVKEANKTDDDKRNEKINAIKSDLEELGVETSKMDFSQKSEESEDSSKKEQAQIEGSNKALDVHETNDEVSTKSDSERIMESMNKTKKILKEG